MDGRKKKKILRQLKEVSESFGTAFQASEDFNERRKIGSLDSNLSDIIKQVKAYL